METHTCPKCNGTMDDGYISSGGDGHVGYISNNQTGMLRAVTLIRRARACADCGYVEMYLDPKELMKKIS